MKTNDNLVRNVVAINSSEVAEPIKVRKVSVITGEKMTKRQNAAYNYILTLKRKEFILEEQLFKVREELCNLSKFIESKMC
jgi:hypothetical protein